MLKSSDVKGIRSLFESIKEHAGRTFFHASHLRVTHTYRHMQTLLESFIKADSLLYSNEEFVERRLFPALRKCGVGRIEWANSEEIEISGTYNVEKLRQFLAVSVPNAAVITGVPDGQSSS